MLASTVLAMTDYGAARIKRVEQIGERLLERLVVLDPAAAGLADEWREAVAELRLVPAEARAKRLHAHWLGAGPRA